MNPTTEQVPLLFDPWPRPDDRDFGVPPNRWERLNRETREIIGGAAVQIAAQQGIDPDGHDRRRWRLWEAVRHQGGVVTVERDLQKSGISSPVEYLAEVLQKVAGVEEILRARCARDHAVLDRLAQARTHQGDAAQVNPRPAA